MRKKSFTLMEVLVVMIILSILATLGWPAYQYIMDDQKAKVCQMNLEALGTALDIYAMDHDTFPGSLSELPEQYLQKGFAKVMQRKDAWKIRLAYNLVGFEQRGLAYAGLLTTLAKGNSKLLVCPAAAPGSQSYAIRRSFRNSPTSDYRYLTDAAILIADSTQDAIDNMTDVDSSRHKRGSVSFGQMVSSSITETDTPQTITKTTCSGNCTTCLQTVRNKVLTLCRNNYPDINNITDPLSGVQAHKRIDRCKHYPRYQEFLTAGTNEAIAQFGHDCKHVCREDRD